MFYILFPHHDFKDRYLGLLFSNEIASPKQKIPEENISSWLLF